MPHPLARIAVKSSNVLSYQHCPKCQGLYVEFKGHHLYKYSPVTEQEWNSLRAADSIGSWIHHRLKATERPYQYLGVEAQATVEAEAAPQEAVASAA
jgi:hypothetical protein